MGEACQIPLPSAVVRTHEHAVVVQADDGVSLRRSAERWQRIIGGFARRDGPRDRTERPSSTLAITGAGGTPVNGARTLPAVPMLPAASWALTCSVCPLICGGFSVKVKLPEALAVAVPSTVPPLEVIITVLFGSATPVSVVPLAFTASPVGMPGATVSTTIAAADDMPLVLPALSVAVMVKEWVPVPARWLGCDSRYRCRPPSR